MTITVTVPLKTVSALNVREHWGERVRRVKKERTLTRLTWAACVPPKARAALKSYAGQLTVHLVRVSPGTRPVDSDAVPGACKGVRDELAACLGLDDGDERVTWTYGQTRGAWGVRVTVEGAGA